MDFEDDEEEYEQNFPRIKKEEIDDGYQEFKSQQARGILYKLSPLTNDIQQKVTDYVHNGAMQADLRYARELFGLINTSGRRDFSYVWESPWIEEHVRDTAKRRKIETQQRSTAVRNFLKASSSHDSDNVDKFMQNVDQLTKWEETYDSKEDVKTISLRRSPDVYDLFANIVACEINWADGTNGSKNLSIYASRQLEYKKENALIKMMHGLDKIHGKEITKDNIGLPLMNIDFNICVSKGVLLVGSNSNSATYILDIEDNNDANGRLDLSGVKTIKIIQKFDNNSLIPKHEKSKKQETQKGFLDL